MVRLIKRIILWTCISALALVSFAWSVLALPFFSGIRSNLVSDALSELIGQPLEVKGDVSVVVGTTSRVSASDVVIPSENIDDVNLAQLANFEFDIKLLPLLERRLDMDNLFVDGLKVELRVNEDGTESWSAREKKAIGSNSDQTTASQTANTSTPATTKEGQSGVLVFLKDKTVAFTNIQLLIDDQVSGFEYDFELEEFSLSQLDEGTTLGLQSNGTVNGQAFNLVGNYPEAAPFTTQADFSSVSLSFNGEPTNSETGGGYTAELAIVVEGVGDLLDVLKLNRSFDGSGGLSARIENRSGVTSVNEIKTELELADGQLIALAGDIANFGDLEGIELLFNARLHPENEPPENAQDLSQLVLSNISTRLVGKRGSMEFEDLLISTNAFEQGLEELGPVSIGRIRRTEAGTLAFQQISLQAGPIDDPILVAEGYIDNILDLKNLAITGKIDAPASLVLSGLGEDVAESFGGIVADFEVDDSEGKLTLRRLVAESVDTEVWALSADMQVGSLTYLDGFSAKLELGIADGAKFLSSLGLEPVDTGGFGFSMDLQGSEKKWAGELGISSRASDVKSSLSVAKENTRPTIRASLISEDLAISDLRNGFAGLVELQKIGRDSAAGETTEKSDADTAGSKENEETMADGPAEASEENETDLFPDLYAFFRATDVYGEIDFKKITGIKGVTRVSTSLASENGDARLGPLEFNYAGGVFKFEARTDFVETPEIVSVSGSTSGWRLGEILEGAGIEFDADGDLRGNFAVTGNYANVDSFLKSMYGTAAIYMVDGRVATSLLELAGLGILPWLFSEELRQGYTDVVCVSLPLEIDGSRIFFDSAVAETQSVQLVAKGSVDPVRDTIELRAEPRPVGEPLSRSAWPFDITGSLSEPEFKLDVGGSRSRRADGANEMPADRQPCEPDILQLQ